VHITEVVNRGRYYFPDPAAIVVSIHERASSATVDVDTPVEASLIAVVTRHKYWSAAIDGREAAIGPANIAYQSVTVPPGRHRVTWRYRNPIVLWSGVFSALSWIAAIAIMTRRLRLRPPQSES
jgi:uncharacterized membrane protein YfhO